MKPHSNLRALRLPRKLKLNNNCLIVWWCRKKLSIVWHLPADTLSWPSLSQAASIVDNNSKKVTVNSGNTKSVGNSLNGNLPLNDVLSAVYTEMIDMSKRRTNLIIYGLPLSSQQSEGERFKDFSCHLAEPSN